MAIQTFTTGQTLTAAQMTSLQGNDYNWTVNAQTASYVLVASDAGKHVTMTNASATTITVNTSLFTAGDFLRITNLGAGTCTITAGTATVATAGTLALAQYASGVLWFQAAGVAYFFPDQVSGTSGLVRVTATTAFTTQTTVSMAASTFTSTYNNYIVMLNVNSTGSAAAATSFRVNNAGSPRAVSGYYGGAAGYNSNGATSGSASSNASAFRVGDQSTSTVQAFQINVYNPASATIKTSMSVNGFTYSDTVVYAQALSGGCIYFTAEANDGLTFTFANTCSGTYAVYGVLN